MWYMYCKLGPIYFHWVVRQIASDPKGWLAASKRMPVHMAVATWCMNSAAMDVRMLCFQGVLGFAKGSLLHGPSFFPSPWLQSWYRFSRICCSAWWSWCCPSAESSLKASCAQPFASAKLRPWRGTEKLTIDDMDGWAIVKGKWWKMMINHGMVILNLGWCVSMPKSVSAKDLHILSAKMAKLSQAAGHDCLTICSQLLQAMPSGKSADQWSESVSHSPNKNVWTSLGIIGGSSWYYIYIIYNIYILYR